jgi:hypothetical protein
VPHYVLVRLTPLQVEVPAVRERRLDALLLCICNEPENRSSTQSRSRTDATQGETYTRFCLRKRSASSNFVSCRWTSAALHTQLMLDVRMLEVALWLSYAATGKIAGAAIEGLEAR